MPRFSQDEIEQMSCFIAAGEIDVALGLYRTQYPPTGDKVFQDLDGALIEGLLATKPSTLVDLDAAELREVQVVAALTFLVGHRTRPDKLLRPEQHWSHRIPLGVAISAVISNYNWTRDRESLKRWNVKRAWHYLQSCDPGTCIACKEAGRFLYSDEDFPGCPVSGCSNLKDGCRCLAVNRDPRDAQELVDSGKLQLLSAA